MSHLQMIGSLAGEVVSLHAFGSDQEDDEAATDRAHAPQEPLEIRIAQDLILGNAIREVAASPVELEMVAGALDQVGTLLTPETAGIDDDRRALASLVVMGVASMALVLHRYRRLM